MGNAASTAAKNILRKVPGKAHASRSPPSVRGINPNGQTPPVAPWSAAGSPPTRESDPSQTKEVPEMPDELVTFLSNMGPATVKVREEMTSERLLNASAEARKKADGGKDDTGAPRDDAASIRETQGEDRRRTGKRGTGINKRRPLPTGRPWLDKGDIATDTMTMATTEPTQEEVQEEGWKISETRLVGLLQRSLSVEKNNAGKALNNTDVTKLALDLGLAGGDADSNQTEEVHKIIRHIISQVSIPVVFEEKDGTKVAFPKNMVEDVEILGLKMLR
uniref:Uncharacterized protein n=1 Tax=Corethron hystrix TaxID=216773 RepID=A0A7S1B2Y1_9STRA|mmetsp:Transcript_10640/g.23424  ORF Transcript_10640/g.23424 Transcript_10640/m.23424 type:complete len:277 (+) Transcript_10640:61-891(+)